MDDMQLIDFIDDTSIDNELDHALNKRASSGRSDPPSVPTEDGFLDYLTEATFKLTADPEHPPGRGPTVYEQNVARTLWEAYSESIKVVDLEVVSAATGSGKTNGGLILLAYLYLSGGRSGAFLSEHNAEVQRDYEKLLKLLPADVVGVWSHFHDVNVDGGELAQEEAEKGIRFTRPFSKETLKQHPVIVTTHHQWVAESKGASRGIRRYESKERHLIIIDEEVRIDDTFTCQPQDVAALADLYSDTKVGEEAHSYGFSTKHFAVETLRDIASSMGALKDEQRHIAPLTSSDAMITERHREVIRELTLDDLKQRMQFLIRADKMGFFDDAIRAKMFNALSFIQSCSEGMAFYAKDSARGGTFFGYKPPLPPERRTLVLDGTAEINAVYRLTRGMHISRSRAPNYEQIKVYFHELPKLFKGRMNDRGLYANALTAAAVMNYFLEWSLLNTKGGDKVLVYGKKRLLSFKSWMQWAGAEVVGANSVKINGRMFDFVNFGRGRGSNDWRNCNVYVQIHDYHQARGPIAARVGSLTSRALGPSELANMSSSSTSHSEFNFLQSSHIRVHAKQNSARTRMRNLDPSGRAPPTTLHFIGSEFKALADGYEAMYPKAPMPEWRAALGEELRVKGKCAKASSSGYGANTEALCKLLMETEETIIDGKVVFELTGILPNKIIAALSSKSIAPIVKTRRIVKTTRKAVGLAGKGYVLQRLT
ncbi:MAG TPA: DEAD/DEAH box helicase family protein [Steroidobacteraceae bacterium]|jgi:hypothetical protein